MYKLIVFDMDGVIFPHFNFWMELHKAFGTYEEGLDLTKKYLKINYSKLVDEVVGKLWKNKSAKPYFDLVKKQKYLPGVKETFNELKKKGYKIAIISSGPSHLAKKAQKDLNIDYIYTNELVIKDNKVIGKFKWPIGDAKKAVSLRKFCEMHHTLLKDCIVICHGENDIKMAKIVGFSIAFNPTTEELKKVCNFVIEKAKNLKEILPVIEKFEKRKVFIE